IPHLNDLSRKYPKDKVAFVSVSFEEPERVLNFLNKKAVLANVGVDTTKNLIKEFGVKSFPTTFLIDKSGILRWKGYPSRLTTQIIDATIQKKTYPKIDIPNKNNANYFADDYSINFPIQIKKNKYMRSHSSGSHMNAKEIGFINYTLPSVLAKILRISEKRILSADTNHYDIRFKIPENISKEELSSAFLQSLVDELDYDITKSKRLVKGYSMNLVSDNLFINNAVDTTRIYEAAGTSLTDKYWYGDGVTLDKLTEILETKFEIYVKNNTSINGYFNFKIPISSFDLARTKLKEHYGITLIKGNIEIEFIKVIEN
ncbi:MAG: TlpA disulfide reductase family protein, partial [Fulvivirga sp.]|nr:TlpA disulfide reductase family protein [Fulvivirga sp.]